ncbi:MAG: proline iminopeptidase, partial [Candidatus Azotimanducaceae bacterium]
MLFPAIKSSATWRLPVSDGHTLYLEESGNPAGIPVVFFDRGPGG